MPWTASIDGGARGNPGPAGAGVEIRDEHGRVVFAAGFFLGRMTCNQAEYEGLLRALAALARAGAGEIRILSDSELLVRQLNGTYRVRAAHLQELHRLAQEKLAAFRAWEALHIPREQNRQADRLANQAMDAVADVIVLDRLGVAGEPGRAPSPSLSSPGTSRPHPPDRPDSGPASGPAQARSAFAVEVRVVRKPQSCPAGIRLGQTFAFTSQTPAGLCVHACAAVIEAVTALLDSADGQADPQACREWTVSCPRDGCGAVFRVAPAGGTSGTSR